MFELFRTIKYEEKKLKIKTDELLNILEFYG